MKIITFSAIKGGVGKSSLCILCARYLSSLGKKVLCMDLDIQNSLTFFFMTDVTACEEKNIAQALFNQDIQSNILQIHDNLFLVPSSLNLIDLRTISINTLKHLLKNLDNFDFCLIDTAPSFDNIVLNAVIASDKIITPVHLTQFEWKSAQFFHDRIERETDNVQNWSLLKNRFSPSKSQNPKTLTNQYLKLFQDTFPNALLKTEVPEINSLSRVLDTEQIIKKYARNHQKLFTAVQNLISEITGISTIPELF